MCVCVVCVCGWVGVCVGVGVSVGVKEVDGGWTLVGARERNGKGLGWEFGRRRRQRHEMLPHEAVEAVAGTGAGRIERKRARDRA